MKIAKSSAALLLLVSLTNCATTNSKTAGGSSGYHPYNTPTNLFIARRQIMRTYDEYGKKMETQRAEQTGFDAALLTLATGTVAAAFFRGSADLIGGLGLGTGSVGAFEKYYNPDGEGAVYIDAKKRLLCLMSASQPILIENPDLAQASTVSEKEQKELEADARAATPEDKLAPTDETSEEQLIRKVAELKERRAATSVTDTLRSAEQKLQKSIDDAGQQASTSSTKGQAQSNAADAARDAALSALAALRAERAAYIMAAPTLWAGYDAILAHVDAGLHRSAIQVASVQQDLTASISQAGAQAAAVGTARSQLITAIKTQAVANSTPTAPAGTPKAVADSATATSELIKQTSDVLSENLPNPLYTAVLANIQQCTSGY